MPAKFRSQTGINKRARNRKTYVVGIEVKSCLSPSKQDHTECHHGDDKQEEDKPEVVNAEISR